MPRLKPILVIIYKFQIAKFIELQICSLIDFTWMIIWLPYFYFYSSRGTSHELRPSKVVYQPDLPNSTESTDLYRVFRPFYELERASTIRPAMFQPPGELLALNIWKIRFHC